MTILKDALNCREPKVGLEMSLSNWDKVCSEATDGPWLSLLSAWTQQRGGERGKGARVRCCLASFSLAFASREKVLFPSTWTERGRRDRGWEKAAAPGSSGDQTALDSSILFLPGRVLMWRESSLKPWASLSVSRVSHAGQSPQWVAVSGSSVS